MNGLSFLSIRKGFDVAPLLERLRATNLWTASERETMQGSPHSEAQSIIARWNDEDQQAASLLMPELGEAVMSVLEQLEAIGELGRVMLTKVPPGGQITKHNDEGVYADLFDRFHLCLAGDQGNTFHCGGETYHPEPGEIFWFNHKREHRVENAGAVDRIHLIVDAMAPKFTKLRGRYYQQEMVSDLWEEAEPLLQAHWKEIARYLDIELDPDKLTYQLLEDAGQVRCYTARDCGHLTGYVVFFVKPNLHYKGSVQAYQDVLFMREEHRAGMAGVRLIKFAEQRLSAEGVQVVYHHAKRTNRVGELLVRLGYELVDEIYAKRLDREKEATWPP